MNTMNGSHSGNGEYLLEALDIVKRFGDFTANAGVTLRLRPGEIHALLGENGAGKSTLVKIVYGALQPTAGRLRWRGRPVTVANPAAARRLGIGMVFQHFSLFEALSLTENIALALPGGFDRRALGARIARVSAEYGLPLEPGALVADLSVGGRQRIERATGERGTFGVHRRARRRDRTRRRRPQRELRTLRGGADRRGNPTRDARGPGARRRPD